MEEFDQAVDSASQAFKTWSKQSVLARQRFAIESVFEYPPHLTNTWPTYAVFRLQYQIRQNADALAHSIVLEQGKTLAGTRAFFVLSVFSNHFPDAHGDVLRGLQVVETAIGITSNIVGEKLEGMCVAWLVSHGAHVTVVSKDMDTEVRKLPLGVCARSVLKHPT
jgi:malonate-semialdehyde dehydrogenase (acetylating)/methylmalonate-semialdehyde dehydrogenase